MAQPRWYSVWQKPTNNLGRERSAANVYVEYSTSAYLNDKWRTLEVVMIPQQVWKVVGVILLVCGLQLYGQQTASGAPTYTTFDPLGSTSTSPSAINPAGAITGYYEDTSFVFHGFLRAPNGGEERPPKVTFTTFDFPASADGPSLGTQAYAINPAGAITGSYYD